MLLLKLVESAPAYLGDTERRWLTALLVELAQFECELGWPTKRYSMLTLPVTQLGFALLKWVKASYSDPDPFKLLPFYVLATADFVEGHLVGRYFYSSDRKSMSWRVEPALDLDERDTRNIARFIDEPGFKREFTQTVGRKVIRGVVPEGGRAILHTWARSGPHEQVLAPGQAFDFVISRCPTSSGVYDQRQFECIQPARAFDWFDWYNGYGYIPNADHPWSEGPLGEVPMRWLTCYRQQATDPSEGLDVSYSWVELPEWITGSPSGSSDSGSQPPSGTSLRLIT